MAGIRSIGWCVPKGRRSAAKLALEFGVSVESIEAFGLKSRAEPDKHDHPSTMGARAVRYALEVAGLAIDDVGLLIFAGMTRDYPAPWVGAYGVLSELRSTTTAGLDIANRCASVHDALWLAAKLIDAGTHKRVVVCCADRFDYLFDANQPVKSPADISYAAGAAAAVVDSEAENTIAAYAGYANPDLSVHTQNVPLTGGSRMQVDEDSIASGIHRRRHSITLNQTRGLVDYLRQSDARNIPAVAKAAGFAEIDFVIASPLDVKAQLLSFAELGIPASKTFFLLSRIGHVGPADSLINLAASTSSKKIGTRIVMSTRTATFSNAIAVRGTGSTLGIRIKGSGISQTEIDQCL
jgi:3-oxoacyl-[acyl-carrier-protein] synthase III